MHNKNKIKPTKPKMFKMGDRVSYEEKPGRVLSHSRQDENLVIVEFDKTFEVKHINSHDLKALPSEIDLPGLSDFDQPLDIWLTTISQLINNHGPKCEMYTDAGYNNVNFKLRLK